MDDGTAPFASRLGEVVTFAHFGALASVKSLPRNHGCWPTTTPPLEAFEKNAFPTTTKVTRNHFTPLGEASRAATTTQQQRQQQNISHRWGNVVAEVLLLHQFVHKNTTKSAHTVGGALTTTQQQNNNNATANATRKPINTSGERRG